MLGGLTKYQETKSRTGIPGLASIPVIGRLFTGESVDRQRQELMIALIPHIVRRPEYTAENLRGIAVGNQQSVHLNYGRQAGATPRRSGSQKADAGAHHAGSRRRQPRIRRWRPPNPAMPPAQPLRPIPPATAPPRRSGPGAAGHRAADDGRRPPLRPPPTAACRAQAGRQRRGPFPAAAGGNQRRRA